MGSDDYEASAEGSSPSSRDYLFRLNSQYREYFFTNSGISEVKIRSKVAGAAISQLGVFGGAINSSLGKRAMKSVSSMTLAELRSEGLVIKDVGWGDVKKVVLKGKKLKISANGLHLSLKMSRGFLKSSSKVDRLVAIFAAFAGDRFVTNHEIPADLSRFVTLGDSGLPKTANQDKDEYKGEANTESKDLAKEQSVKKQATAAEENTNIADDAVKADANSETKKSPGPIPENNNKSVNNFIFSRKHSKKMIYTVLAVLVAVVVIVSLVHVLLPVSHNAAGIPVYTSGTTTFSSNSFLTGNVYAGNVTIDSGVTVVTNGYNFFVSYNFINKGTIITGHESLLVNLPNSYGGSGGGGGFAYDNYNTGENGYSTIAPGGAGGNIGGNGVNPGNPVINAALLRTWNGSSVLKGMPDSISQYISGADGGYGGLGSAGSHPGLGSYGIVIEAQYIYAGVIYANGTSTVGGGAGSGGGGGGVIILAYGSGGIVAGTYNVAGGSGQAAGVTYADNYGGNGGNGSVIVYDYGTTPPIYQGGT